MAKVQFKYGTWAKYSALSSKDEDTLYFITDKNLFFKGSSPFGNVVGAVATGSGETEGRTITFTASDGTEVSFTVPTAAALAAVKSAKVLANGSNGQVLTIGSDGKPGWGDLPTGVSAGDITGLLPIAHGGTGASDAAGARTNLGLGSAATKSSTTSVTSGGSWHFHRQKAALAKVPDHLHPRHNHRPFP